MKTHYTDEPRQLKFKKLSEIEPKAVEWLWPDRLPLGKFVLFTGAPDAGKTQCAIDIAARITNGSEWPDGGKAEFGSVIILTAEDGLNDTIRTRADAAGADVTKIECLTATLGENGIRSTFSLQADLILLGEKIAAMKDVRLIIIDPITAYLGAGKIDTHKTSDVRAVLSPLSEFAEEHRVTILGITHPPKTGNGKAMHAATGSLAFIAAARSGYLFTVESEAKRTLMLPIKNNLGPRKDGLAFTIVQCFVHVDIISSHIVWDSQPVTMTADEAMAADMGCSNERATKKDAEEFLQEMLGTYDNGRPGPVPVKEVNAAASALMIPRRALERGRKHLGVVASCTGYQGEWVLELPKVRQSLPDSTTPERCVRLDPLVDCDEKDTTEDPPEEASPPPKTIQPEYNLEPAPKPNGNGGAYHFPDLPAELDRRAAIGPGGPDDDLSHLH